MDARAATLLADLLDPDRDRPLGDMTAVSNRINAKVSHGLQHAADNLLAKALRAFLAGEETRAVDYVERAVRLPFDEHEQVPPGWWAASMLMFAAVTDTLESCREDDTSWLAAAEHVLHDLDGREGPEGYGRVALLDTLRTIAGDYHVPPQEARRIKNAVHGFAASSWTDGPPAEIAEQVQAILAVVHAVAAYQQALAAEPPRQR